MDRLREKIHRRAAKIAERIKKTLFYSALSANSAVNSSRF